MKKAFTLIELLVVIAIIGLLSSIVLVSMSGVRGKARDAKTKSDVNQISLAMQLYYDTNGSYPSSDGTWRCLKASGNCWKAGYVGDSDITSGLSSYMSAIPTTQAKSGCYLYDAYLYNSNQAGLDGYPTGAYVIWAKESGAFETGECQGAIRGPYDCGEYHCYQFIGAN
jgi:prepilin-type N-terminal cleavage/methylation domain-containing protein